MAHDYGIGVFAVLPITITEPADRAKNIVGELLHGMSLICIFLT